MKVNFEIGQYGEDLVQRGTELKSAEEFKFYPCKPITIVDATINMVDDYNGRVEVKLSNDHTVTYRCKEVNNHRGPEVEMEVVVSRPGQTGYLICGAEFGEKYISNYGSWINSVMACYVDYHKKQF